MFRPLSGNFQTIKIYKIKIGFATSYFVQVDWDNRLSVLQHTRQYEMLKWYNVNINVKKLQCEYKNVKMLQWKYEMLKWYNIDINVKML